MPATKAANWRNIENDREKYAAYLCSREWAVKKEAVHKRADGKCERCKVLPIDAVHHLTYERKYVEPLEDMEGHCESCHEFTHGKSTFDPQQWKRELGWLLYCKKYNEIPMPFELAAGLRLESELEEGINHHVRGMRLLLAADMELAAISLERSLPFNIPNWYFIREAIWANDPMGLDWCYQVVGVKGQDDPEWWQSEDEDDA